MTAQAKARPDYALVYFSDAHDRHKWTALQVVEQVRAGTLSDFYVHCPGFRSYTFDDAPLWLKQTDSPGRPLASLAQELLIDATRYMEPRP